MGGRLSCPCCSGRSAVQTVDTADEGEWDQLPEMIRLLEQIEEANKGVNLDREVAKETEIVGDLQVPRRGDENAREFQLKNLLDLCLAQCKDMFEDEFDVPVANLISDLLKENTKKISCAISDPAGNDCPLVYVSPYFEAMTGYPTRFCLGRSCRFLQPTALIVNDAINFNDRERLRAFCKEDYDGPKTIVALLMNEKKDGRRFWNLLKMSYVTLVDKKYIFAMQTVIDSYMPKVLRTRTDEKIINELIAEVMDELVAKVDILRKRLSYMTNAPLTQLREFVKDHLNDMKKRVIVNGQSWDSNPKGKKAPDSGAWQ